MSWYSPRMTANAGASSSSSQLPSSAAPPTSPSPPPETPASVPDLHAGLCRDIIQFRHFLARYRALDDRITSLLNRTLASSRESGRNLPPSLLLPLPTASGSPWLQEQQQRHSSQPPDAGLSTYGRGDMSSCATLWDQLVRVWSGREDSVRFCLAVTESAREAIAGSRGTSTTGSGSRTGSSLALDDVSRLDADLTASSSASTGTGLTSTLSAPRPSDYAHDASSGRRVRKTKDRDALQAPELWRSQAEDEEAWRGRREAEEEALARQLHNELVVDQILRRRSIDVFRSRCPSFVPPKPTSAAPTSHAGQRVDGSTEAQQAVLLARSWAYWNEK